MKANWYAIIGDAVDRGLEHGWRRAYKHTDKPHENEIKNAIADEIMTALSEVIIWDESN